LETLFALCKRRNGDNSGGTGTAAGAGIDPVAAGIIVGEQAQGHRESRTAFSSMNDNAQPTFHNQKQL